jgi:ATP-independent RNA helicase DbpA
MNGAFPPLPEPLSRAVAELGFTAPTPIQAAALPIALEGRDLVARSRTGSGKTAAFALPLLARIDLGWRGPQALVLCPTRELATQVATAIRALGRHLPGLRVRTLVGGEPGGTQRRALEEGAHVVVGTPGRVNDHLDRGSFDPGRIAVAVLDEADRMLDMGFAEQVELVLGALPGDRLTLFFSATYPRSIAEMSAAWQRDPAHVAVDDDAPDDLRQVACVVEDKEAALTTILRAHPGPALVFSAMKATALARAQALDALGIPARYLGGDLEQLDRDRVLACLRTGGVRALVATDVAGRGLDVDALPLVVNVELPGRPEVYVHRVGRTARAGKEGLAVALAHPSEGEKLRRYGDATGRPLDVVPLDVLAAELAALPRGESWVTLELEAGRRDKLRPGDVLGALTGDGGLVASEVGRIVVGERRTWVGVAQARVGDALAGLARVKGRRLRVTRA